MATNNLVTLYEKLNSDDFFTQLTQSLPEGISPGRFKRVAWSTIRNTPELSTCSSESLLQGIMKSAVLGLEPLLGMVYLVPFDNKKAGRKEAQMIIGYRGMLELARRSGKIASIWAHVVHEGDQFHVEYGMMQKLEHVPCAPEKRGPLKAAYACAKLVDTDTPIFMVLYAEDVQKRRNMSRGSSSKFSPWEMWPEEMWRKSALRALWPFLPVSVDVQGAVLEEEVRENAPIDVEAFEVPRTLDALAETLYVEARIHEDDPENLNEEEEATL